MGVRTTKIIEGVTSRAQTDSCHSSALLDHLGQLWRVCVSKTCRSEVKLSCKSSHVEPNARIHAHASHPQFTRCDAMRDLTLESFETV